MTLGERIKVVRKGLGLSQEEFGKSLGVSRNVIKNMELDLNKGNNETVLRLICKTHRANYFYLTDGKGDPFIGLPEIILDEAVEEYGLDELDRTIIEEYVKMDSETRNALKNYLKAVFKNTPD